MTWRMLLAVLATIAFGALFIIGLDNGFNHKDLLPLGLALLSGAHI